MLAIAEVASPNREALHVIAKAIRLFDSFRKILPARLVDAAAKRCGYGERRRKCPPDRFFWTLVLGFGCEAQRSLASLQRFFCTLTGESITSSAFQKRFTPKAAAFLEDVLRETLATSSEVASPAMGRKLERFRQVLALDSTVLKLHRRLARHFRGFRSQGTEAMAKLHVVHNLGRRDMDRLTLTSGRVHDQRGAITGPHLRGTLSLFDLGYYSHDLFRRIERFGGLFLSRLQTGANPLLLRVRRGRSRLPEGGARLAGLRMEDGVLDADAQFGEGRHVRVRRVVGVWDLERERWSLYVTNLPPGEFSAEELLQLYRLRWEVELLFKELRSAYRLDDLPTSKPATVRCLIYAALLSMLLGRVLTRLSATRSGVHPRTLSPRRIAAVLGHHALDLGRALLAHDRQQIGRVLARMADLATVIARAAPPRGAAHELAA
jgi:putative transposase